MPFWSLLIQLPDELVRKSPVIVLLHLCVKLLHPPNFHEEFGEVFVGFFPNLSLHAVPEFVVAVGFPEGVYGLEVGLGDELGFGEEDVAALYGLVAGEGDEEAPGLLVGLPEVLGGEVVAEEVKGEEGVGLGGGGGCCGGDEGESGGGERVGEWRSGGGGWFEEERGGGEEGGGRGVYGVAPEERVVEGLEGVGGHEERESGGRRERGVGGVWLRRPSSDKE